MTDRRNKIHAMEENVITTFCVYEIWKYESSGPGLRMRTEIWIMSAECQPRKILIPSQSQCYSAVLVYLECCK